MYRETDMLVKEAGRRSSQGGLLVKWKRKGRKLLQKSPRLQCSMADGKCPRQGCPLEHPVLGRNGPALVVPLCSSIIWEQPWEQPWGQPGFSMNAVLICRMQQLEMASQPHPPQQVVCKGDLMADISTCSSLPLVPHSYPSLFQQRNFQEGSQGDKLHTKMLQLASAVTSIHCLHPPLFPLNPSHPQLTSVVACGFSDGIGPPSQLSW